MPPPSGTGARLRLVVATGLGCGYAPVASGTFGSLPGLALTWLLWQIAGPSGVALGLVAVIVAGLWSGTFAEQHFSRKDPGAVVIDEVAGQMVTLLLVVPTLPTLLAGFFLFRAFDVLKPFPGRRLEALPGASGIMADDLVAGLYANLALRALHWGFPAWWIAA